MADQDGGPAFPLPDVAGCEGMSLRDWFAGQALAGYLAAPGDNGEAAREDPWRAAAWAYENADTMLAERTPPDSENKVDR